MILFHIPLNKNKNIKLSIYLYNEKLVVLIVYKLYCNGHCPGKYFINQTIIATEKKTNLINSLNVIQ